MADTKIKISPPEPKSSLNKRRLIVGGIAAVLVLIFGFLIISGQIPLGRKVYAEAAGHKIYKKDVDKIKGKAKGITDKQAATVLADKYLTEAMAKEADITVSDKDLVTSYGAQILKEKSNNPYAYQNKVNQVYFRMLSAENTGAYIGKLLITNFSRNVPYQSPALAEDKALAPTIGNPAAIAADKKYAKDLISKLYGQVKAGTITFDQAIEQERNDPVVGEKAYDTLPHSSAFDTSLSPNAILSTRTIREKINSIKAGETTAPFVVRTSDSETGNSTAESFFLVVQMDKTSGGNSKISFQQELTEAKKKLGYKVYV